MKEIKRYELSDVKRLRIDAANCVKLKVDFWNRLKFLLFNNKFEITYIEVNGCIQSGWMEK